MMTVRKAMSIWFLNIDLSKMTSVKLAPALPMIKVIIAPNPMPLAASAALRGITASARI